MKRPFKSSNFFTPYSETFTDHYQTINKEPRPVVNNTSYFQMDQEANINNNIFSYVFTGAILFVAAVAFIVLNLSNIAMFQLSYITIALMLGLASVSLLYRAIKNDKTRLSQI